MSKKSIQHPQPVPMLAIDTSCDETSVAVTLGTVILSNVIATQAELHRPYGGVFPTVAKQAHRENIDPAISLALKRASISMSEIKAIAVTQGPGLAPALEVGIERAKKLASQYGLPLFPIHHIEGHILSVWAQRKSRIFKSSASDNSSFYSSHNDILSNYFLSKLTQSLPSLAIIVSGGHTQFVLCTQPGAYEIIGETIDDAAGECLDKVGRMLNLGYPAGPIVEQFARHGNPKHIAFPLPMTHVSDYALSFSGLKTAARNKIEAVGGASSLSKAEIYDFCASIQYAVFRHITYKLNKILSTVKINEVWLGGGVAANSTLRSMVRTTVRDISKKQQIKIRVRVPHRKELCGDNAAMIGVAASLHYALGTSIPNSETIDRKARWKL